MVTIPIRIETDRFSEEFAGYMFDLFEYLEETCRTVLDMTEPIDAAIPSIVIEAWPHQQGSLLVEINLPGAELDPPGGTLFTDEVRMDKYPAELLDRAGAIVPGESQVAQERLVASFIDDTIFKWEQETEEVARRPPSRAEAASFMKAVRKSLNLTQVQLAERLVVSASLVSRWENSVRPIPPEKTEEVKQLLREHSVPMSEYRDREGRQFTDVSQIDVPLDSARTDPQTVEALRSDLVDALVAATDGTGPGVESLLAPIATGRTAGESMDAVVERPDIRRESLLGRKVRYRRDIWYPSKIATITDTTDPIRVKFKFDDKAEPPLEVEVETLLRPEEEWSHWEDNFARPRPYELDQASIPTNLFVGSVGSTTDKALGAVCLAIGRLSEDMVEGIALVSDSDRELPYGRSIIVEQSETSTPSISPQLAVTLWVNSSHDRAAVFAGINSDQFNGPTAIAQAVNRVFDYTDTGANELTQHREEDALDTANSDGGEAELSAVMQGAEQEQVPVHSPRRFEEIEFVRDPARHGLFVQELESLIASATNAIQEGHWPEGSPALASAERRRDYLSKYLQYPSDLPAEQAEAERMAFSLLEQLLDLNREVDGNAEIQRIVHGLQDLDGTDRDNEKAKQTAIDTRDLVDSYEDRVESSSNEEANELRREAEEAGLSTLEVAKHREVLGRRANRAADRFGPPIPVALGAGSVVTGSVAAFLAGNALLGAGLLTSLAIGLIWGWLRTFPDYDSDD